MRTITLLFILLNLSTLVVAQKNALPIQPVDLEFDYFKKNLNETVKAEIDRAWDKMPGSSQVQFFLLTKEEQKKLSDDHKHKLSAMRADSVINYLQQKRIHPKYISYSIAYFENSRKSQCTSSNAQYREFTRNKKGETSVIVEKDGYARKYYHRSDSLLLTSSCNTYSIYYGEESWVEGGQGTKVKFPAYCFSNSEIKDGDELDVFLCEYYTLDDLILSGITTQSAERIIETGGTIFLKVYYKGKEVHLKTDQFISIYFPSLEKIKNGMETFDGKNKDGLIDWQTNSKGKVRKVQSGELLSDEAYDSTQYNEEMEGYDSEEGFYAELDGYLMRTNKLGYINCDRFYDAPSKSELLVKCDKGNATEKEKMSYRMVFADIKSILPGYEYSPGGKMKFSNLPKGKEAFVIAFYIPKKGGTPIYAIQKVIIGEQDEIELTTRPITLTELKAELNNLF